MKTHTPQPLDPDVDDSFRLMELHAGQGEDQITLRLMDCHVKSAPPYESLSYTWGDASQQVPVRVFYGRGIGIDDNPHDSSHKTFEMNITANCHAALKRLRRPETSRMLWVDSICIDQSMIPERNRQLGLMTNIYQNATQVLIYLGESDDSSDSVMSWIRELDSPSDFGDGSDPAPPSKESLEQFFQRPWFHRVWILQEAAFAKQAIVICGGEETDWTGFISFYHWNTSRPQKERLSLPYSLSYSASEPFHIWESIPSTSYAKALRRMLHASRLSLATNPRDKVYAILPLVKAEYEKSIQHFILSSSPASADTIVVPKEIPVKIKVDYARSISQVFIDAATVLLDELGLDQLLALLISGPQTIPHLPSWIPDWTNNSTFTWRGQGATGPGQHAGYTKPPERHGWEDYSRIPETEKKSWTVSHQPIDTHVNTGPEQDLGLTPSLHIHTAVHVGNIVKAGPICSIADNFFPLKEWGLLASERHHVKVGLVNTDSLSLFERLLTTDVVIYPMALNMAFHLIRHYYDSSTTASAELMEFLAEIESQTPLLLKDIFKGMWLSYEYQADIIFSTCDGRRFVVTDTGYIGLAPGETEIGDAVWVFKQVSMPFVCREFAAGRNQSEAAVKLVGSCHIQGVMKGEAWVGVDADGDVTGDKLVKSLVIF